MSLTTAQAKNDRYKALGDGRAVSQQDLDDAEAAFLQAKADVSVAKANVQSASSFVVRTIFKNSERALLPGLYVRASISLASNDKASFCRSAPSVATTRARRRPHG